MALTREDLKELPALLQSDPELQLELAQLILNESVVAELMRRDSNLRETFRRAVLTEELLKLPKEVREFREDATGRLERLEGEFREFREDVTERLERSDREFREFREDVTERLERSDREFREFREDVTERLERSDREFREFREDVTERLERSDREFREFREDTTGRLGSLETEVAQARQGVNRLESWQRGEVGRRDGEEYERKIVMRARRIFGSGDGGSPARSERIYLQLDRWMVQAGMLEDVDEELDPIAADLIWWKGNRVAVAEISVKVDKNDVLRAKRRAETLGKAGLDTLPVVIGSEWAHPETEQIANQEGVAWRIGNKFSESLIAYRQMKAPE